MSFNKLVLSGGSVRGIAYIGMLKYLEDNDIIISELLEIVGTSIGAFTALLIVIGYTSEELCEIFFNFDFNDIKSPSISCLVDSYGLDNGNKMESMISVFLKNKGHDPDITFKDLYNKTGKNLICTVCNVSTRAAVYISKDTCPDLRVALGTRASMNIPMIFSPVLINGDYHVDGGLCANMPVRYYPPGTPGILCVSLSENKKPRFEIDSIESYMYSVLKTSFSTVEKNDIEYCKKNDFELLNLMIPSTDSTDFNISLETKKRFFDTGYKVTSEFFENK